MKGSELMIGDIVAVNKTSLQIAALGTAKAGFLDAKGEMFYQYYDNIEPIPLTAEILEDSGFDVMEYYNGDKLFAYGSLCILEQKGLLTFKISDCWKRINFVHELQHALKLCGIDKNIKL